MDRATAYQIAKHKSLYGHREWLAWQVPGSGEWRAVREDRDSLREAIEAQREHGQKFYAMSNGVAYAISPKLAELRLANI